MYFIIDIKESEDEDDIARKEEVRSHDHDMIYHHSFIVSSFNDSLQRSYVMIS